MEIKQMHKYNNIIDLITKNKSSSILKTLIDTNCINLNTTEYIKQAADIKKIKKK